MPETTIAGRTRDQWGRVVRSAWVRWARMQPDPKPSWLVPYDGLGEADKEADRVIGWTVARLAIGDWDSQSHMQKMAEYRAVGQSGAQS